MRIILGILGGLLGLRIFVSGTWLLSEFMAILAHFAKTQDDILCFLILLLSFMGGLVFLGLLAILGGWLSVLGYNLPTKLRK